MHALGQLVRRVAAIVTAIAVCGMFTCVHAERTGKTDVAQFTAAKPPLDYAVILPEEFGKVSSGHSWSKPNPSTSVGAQVILPNAMTRVGDEVLAVSESDVIVGPVWLTGVVELRI